MAYITGKTGSFTFSNHAFTFKVNWSNKYDLDLNTSILYIESLELKSDKYDGTWYPSLLIKINDTTIATMSYYTPATHYVTLQKGIYSEVQSTWAGVSSPWQSEPIEHDIDGSKQIDISILPNPSGHNLSDVQIYRADDDFIFHFEDKTETIALTDIPRASSCTLSTYSVDAGSDIDVNIERASSDFSHTVEIYIDDIYYQKYTNVGESKTCTIPIEWCNAMPSSTRCSAHCRITTYKGETQIGYPTRTSFTLNVPKHIIPVIGSFILDPADINGNNILIKGKNSLEINVSNCSAGLGSSIKSYTFVGPSLSQTVSSTFDGSSIRVPSVQAIGNLSYTVTITDTRGRTSSKTQTVVCYDYYLPYFSMFDAYRANANGDQDVNGTYLKCVFDYDYAIVGETNKVDVAVVYNGQISTESLIDLNGDLDTTYKVYLRITDEYGGVNTSDILTVFGQTRIFNITQDGTGIALGKMADETNLFECRWKAKFDDDVNATSINCESITIDTKSIFDLIYPIGSIYMSVNNINPSVIFGGTWEQIKDTFLLSAGDTYSAGDVGGEASVTLSIDQIPTHGHDATSTYSGADFYIRHGQGEDIDMVAAGTNTSVDEGVGVTWKTGVAISSYSHAIDKVNINGTVATTVSNTGGGAAHNNMPPYLAVFMWKRTA